MKNRVMNPFSGSVVDMMLCALGSVVTLFALQQQGDRQELLQARREVVQLDGEQAKMAARADQVERESDVEGRRLRRAHDRLVQADRRVLDAERNLERAHERNAGHVIGMPQPRGDVVFVIDVSSSMGSANKNYAALAALQSLILNHEGIEAIQVIGFSSQVEVWVDWTRPAAPSKLSRQAKEEWARHLVETLGIKPVSADTIADGRWLGILHEVVQRMQEPEGGTDLLGALELAYDSLSMRTGEKSLVLISDGHHSLGHDLTTAEVYDRLRASLGTKPVDDVVTSVVMPVVAGALDDEPTLAAGLAAEAARRGGAFVALACRHGDGDLAGPTLARAVGAAAVEGVPDGVTELPLPAIGGDEGEERQWTGWLPGLDPVRRPKKGEDR